MSSFDELALSCLMINNLMSHDGSQRISCSWADARVLDLMTVNGGETLGTSRLLASTWGIDLAYMGLGWGSP